MWQGTFEQYLQLYEVASLHLKETCSAVLIGGYAASSVAEEFLVPFLENCKERNLPLDFFSYHGYFSEISELSKKANYVKEKLRFYGFAEAEIIFDEWNYFPKANYDGTRERYEILHEKWMKGMIGASFCGAVLISLQELPVDWAHYYDSQPNLEYCGLWNMFGTPSKTYYAFKMFSMMKACGTICCNTQVSECEGVYALAVKSEEKIAVMISNYSDSQTQVKVLLEGMENFDVYTKIYLHSENTNLTQIHSGYYSKHKYPQNGDEINFEMKCKYIDMPAYSCALVISEYKRDCL